MSKAVNEFNVGDGIRMYGFTGIVSDKHEEMRYTENGTPCECTYLKVLFDDPGTVGYQYHGGWYGGRNDLVGYGYFER